MAASDQILDALTQGKHAFGHVLDRGAGGRRAEDRARVLEAGEPAERDVNEPQQGKKPDDGLYEPPTEVTDAEHGAIVASPLQK